VLTRRAFSAGAAAALAGCASARDGRIRVGAFLSLSGPDSTFGSDARAGIDLAAQETNRAGGIRGRLVNVLYEDDKSLVREAAQKVRQLIDRDRVVALLGEIASSRSLAGGLVANTRKVPMVTPSSTAPAVTRNRPWVFRTCFTDDQQGIAAARFVRQHLGRTRMGIFYAAQDTYSSGLARAFRAELERLGGVVAIEKAYAKGETSFRTHLSELKAADVEGIFVPSYYNDMVLVGRQARELGIPGSVFVGGDGWDSANLLEGAGAELEGATYTNHYAPDVPWDNSRAFVAAFVAKHGREPASISAEGYDAATLLFDAIARAGEPRPERIREALAQTSGFRGATGTMTMSAERNAVKPIVVVRITNKSFHYAAQIPVE